MTKKYGTWHPMQVPEIKEKVARTMIARYGNTVVDPMLKSSISQVNKDFQQMLLDNGIESEFEFTIPEFQLFRFDLHIKNSNILVEIDLTVTHNTYDDPWGELVSPDYHLKKTKLAEENGCRCIHVFDWDDWNKVLDLVRPKERIFARKCEVHMVSLEEVYSFTNQNHIQGSCLGQDIALGLYFNGELVELMTFGTPRYSSKYDLELLRLCSKSNVTVVGGASRLFKDACDSFDQGTKILSYCNRAKFTGDVYKKIGMTEVRSTDAQEVWSKDHEFVTANMLRARGYDQLFHTDYGKDVSNEELMIKNKWRPVFDCGQYVFEYTV